MWRMRMSGCGESELRSIRGVWPMSFSNVGAGDRATSSMTAGTLRALAGMLAGGYMPRLYAYPASVRSIISGRLVGFSADVLVADEAGQPTTHHAGDGRRD